MAVMEDRYKEHSPGPWKWIEKPKSADGVTRHVLAGPNIHCIYWHDGPPEINGRTQADINLIGDAVLLLGELEQLREHNERLAAAMRAVLTELHGELDPDYDIVAEEELRGAVKQGYDALRAHEVAPKKNA